MTMPTLLTPNPISFHGAGSSQATSRSSPHDFSRSHATSSHTLAHGRILSAACDRRSIRCHQRWPREMCLGDSRRSATCMGSSTASYPRWPVSRAHKLITPDVAACGYLIELSAPSPIVCESDPERALASRRKCSWRERPRRQSRFRGWGDGIVYGIRAGSRD